MIEENKDNKKEEILLGFVPQKLEVIGKAFSGILQCLVSPKAKRVCPSKLNMKPRIGDIIYLESSLHLSSGWNDRAGGKAHISMVEEKWGGIFIQVEEFPESSYNWEYLEPLQEYLKEQFGKQWAHRDPDYSPEFND